MYGLFCIVTMHWLVMFLYSYDLRLLIIALVSYACVQSKVTDDVWFVLYSYDALSRDVWFVFV